MTEERASSSADCTVPKPQESTSTKLPALQQQQQTPGGCILPSGQPCCSVNRGPQPASSLRASSLPTAPIQAKAPLSTEAALPHCCSLTAPFPPVPKFSQLLRGCSWPGLASSSAVGVTGKTRNKGSLFLSKLIG